MAIAKCKIKFHRLILFFKMKNGIAANHLSSTLQSYICRTRHSLRNYSDFRTTIPRTEPFTSSFFLVQLKIGILLMKESNRLPLSVSSNPAFVLNYLA